MRIVFHLTVAESLKELFLRETLCEAPFEGKRPAQIVDEVHIKDHPILDLFDLWKLRIFNVKENHWEENITNILIFEGHYHAWVKMPWTLVCEIKLFKRGQSPADTFFNPWAAFEAIQDFKKLFFLIAESSGLIFPSNGQRFIFFPEANE